MWGASSLLLLSSLACVRGFTYTLEEARNLGPDILKSRSDKHNSRFLPRANSNEHDPVEIPEESPDTRLDPPADYLERYRHTLERYMSHYWKAARMSQLQPQESIRRPNGTIDWKLQRGLQRAPSAFFRHIGSVKLASGGPRLRLRIKSKSRKKVRHFLYSYTNCPLRYVWKDLGRRFYPRWLKVSECYKGRSCSIPAGMTCKSSESSHLVVLRYYCDEDYNCKWLQMKYKVVTDCSCAC